MTNSPLATLENNTKRISRVCYMELTKNKMMDFGLFGKKIVPFFEEKIRKKYLYNDSIYLHWQKEGHTPYIEVIKPFYENLFEIKYDNVLIEFSVTNRCMYWGQQYTGCKNRNLYMKFIDSKNNDEYYISYFYDVDLSVLLFQDYNCSPDMATEIMKKFAKFYSILDLDKLFEESKLLMKLKIA